MESRWFLTSGRCHFLLSRPCCGASSYTRSRSEPGLPCLGAGLLFCRGSPRPTSALSRHRPGQPAMALTHRSKRHSAKLPSHLRTALSYLRVDGMPLLRPYLGSGVTPSQQLAFAVDPPSSPAPLTRRGALATVLQHRLVSTVLYCHKPPWPSRRCRSPL